jgi:hypothetical protein
MDKGGFGLLLFFVAAIIAIQVGKYIVLNTSSGPDLF